MMMVLLFIIIILRRDRNERQEICHFLDQKASQWLDARQWAMFTPLEFGSILELDTPFPYVSW
ncbi:hypothetical protein Csa_021326, partial [Cucumis sativus]